MDLVVGGQSFKWWEAGACFLWVDVSVLPLEGLASCSFLLTKESKRNQCLVIKSSIKFLSFPELKSSSHDDVTWPLDTKVFEAELLCQYNTWPSYCIFMLTFGPTVNNVVSVVFMNSLGTVTVHCPAPRHGNRRPCLGHT